MKAVKTFLEKARTFLNRSRKIIDAIQHQPVLLQWQKVEVTNVMPALLALGVDPQIQETRKKIERFAGQLTRQAERIDNEAGSLLAEFALQKRDEGKIRQDALALKKRLRLFAGSVKILQQ